MSVAKTEPRASLVELEGRELVVCGGQLAVLRKRASIQLEMHTPRFRAKCRCRHSKPSAITCSDVSDKGFGALANQGCGNPMLRPVPTPRGRTAGSSIQG